MSLLKQCFLELLSISILGKVYDGIRVWDIKMHNSMIFDELAPNETQTYSPKPMTAWFLVERKGILKTSKFKLLAQLTNSILRFKVSEESLKAKYIINFEIVSVEVNIQESKIVLSPLNSHSIFTMIHDDRLTIEDWGYSLLMIADINSAVAAESRHVSRFRWWKVSVT